MIKINKISIATLAAAGLVFCSTSAFADGAPFVDQNPIVVANNEVGIAATGTLMNYQEHITEVPSDIESGWMPGFAVKYSLMSWNQSPWIGTLRLIPGARRARLLTD